MNMLLSIAAGGAIGALARHFVAARVLHMVGGGFPWGILVCNVLGSVIMGVLVEAVALRWSIGPELRAFLTVGVLGAFTTFSTFSLDAVLLLQRGETLAAGGYILASVVFSVGGLIAGMQVMRLVLT